MRIFVLLFYSVFLLFTASIGAESGLTFEQAKAASIETGRPILLEFVHED